MKDRAFSGSDIADALAVASAALGIPVAAIRYVVLDPGSTGRVGASPTPARIAVMLDSPGARPAVAAEGEEEEGEDDFDGEEEDPLEGIREVVSDLARVAGVELTVEIEEGREAVQVRLDGDRTFLLGEDGRGEVLRAVEHLLQRMFGPDVHPLMVRVECAGFRERRDSALETEARAVAEDVKREGKPRTMPALNAYERRVVHMALSGMEGIVTYSVGEGADRRVTIAPAGAPGDAEPGHGQPGPGA